MKKKDDFNCHLDFTKGRIETSYLGKPLILYNPYFYEGPITLQLLPYGGIQSVFNNHLIIYTKDGFIACDLVEYNGILMSSEKFISIEENLVNHILPS